MDRNHREEQKVPETCKSTSDPVPQAPNFLSRRMLMIPVVLVN